MRTFLSDMSTKAKAAAKGKSGQKATKKTAKKPAGKKAKKSAQKRPGSSAAKRGAKTSAKPSAKTGTAAKTAKTAKSGKAAAKYGTSGQTSGGTSGALTQQRLPMAARVLILVLAFAAMVGFAVVLSKLTLGPSAASESLTHSNLRPGDSIRDYLSQPALRDTVKQLGGNIVLGMPFGALLPALVPRTRGLLRVALATALVMLLVELVQGALVTGRAFDIDDVILNTTGAMLGYLIIGRRLGLAVHPRRRHWWHRRGVSPSRGRP